MFFVVVVFLSRIYHHLNHLLCGMYMHTHAHIREILLILLEEPSIYHMFTVVSIALVRSLIK